MAVKPLFLDEDIQYDYHIMLTEADLNILKYNEPIKLDSEYINDFLNRTDVTEEDVPNFSDLELFDLLKADMEFMANKICASLRALPQVADAYVGRSGSVGISTYITVDFNRLTLEDAHLTPKELEKAQERINNDPKFVSHFESGFGHGEGMSGEFKLKIRLSSHPYHRTDAYIDINILGKVYQYFKKRVTARVKERINYIDVAWTQYCKTGKLPKNQAQRNTQRKTAKSNLEPVVMELLNHMKSYIAKSLKESFGSDRLQAVLEIEAQNVLDYLKFTDTKIEDIISAVESEFRDYKVNYVQLIKATAECLVDNIIDYTFEDSFDYDMLFNDIREELDNDIIDENIVSDLNSNDIHISPKVLKNISLDVDIQSANVVPLNIQKWQELKNKYILIANNATNEIIAIYNKDKFDYNPDKLKVSELTDKDLYSCFEVTNISSIRQKHNDRIALKQDYVDLQNSNNEYNKPPKSTRYVFDRDWNPERNKAYYTKLLQQNKLGEYSRYLEEVYDVIENLIDHRRKEKTTGKKLVYSNYIKKLASQIESLETEMDALDKNVNINLDKLKRNLKSLSNSTDLAKEFLRTEDDAIKVWGYPKQRPHRKIER